MRVGTAGDGADEVEYAVEFGLSVAIASPADASRLAPLLRRAGTFCYRLRRSLDATRHSG